MCSTIGPLRPSVQCGIYIWYIYVSDVLHHRPVAAVCAMWYIYMVYICIRCAPPSARCGRLCNVVYIYGIYMYPMCSTIGPLRPSVQCGIYIWYIYVSDVLR